MRKVKAEEGMKARVLIQGKLACGSGSSDNCPACASRSLVSKELLRSVRFVFSSFFQPVCAEVRKELGIQ